MNTPPPGESGRSIGEILELLATAEITGIGLHPEGTNYVFVVKLDPGDGAEPTFGIYKPQRGERPLRDFPRGTLYLRECASYELSTALGWPLIPPTVVREGPHGIGSVQLYIEADRSQNYFTLRDDELERFEPVAAFDILVNNADRKAGACLKDADGRLWAIDQGLTFNPDARIRTVMWEFSGERFSDALVSDLRALGPRLAPSEPLAIRLRELISESEVEALRQRLDRIVARPCFPVLDPQLNVPWPFV